MKRSAGSVVLLLLAAFLMVSCGASGNMTPDGLLQRIAAAAETVFSRQTEQWKNTAASTIVDFDSLHKINSELYAWLIIPGTSINAPIAQSETENIAFYQSHGPDRSESEYGCLYTHYRYSDRRFDEKVSVIYGKTAVSVSCLDGIEETYRSLNSLRDHQDVFVVIADRVLHYQVFCASEFSDVLISRDYRDFQTEDDVTSFLLDVRSYHTLQRQFDEDAFPDAGDRILVLSKKLSRDADQRFLVLAKLVDTAD